MGLDPGVGRARNMARVALERMTIRGLLLRRGPCDRLFASHRTVPASQRSRPAPPRSSAP